MVGMICPPPLWIASACRVTSWTLKRTPLTFSSHRTPYGGRRKREGEEGDRERRGRGEGREREGEREREKRVETLKVESVQMAALVHGNSAHCHSCRSHLLTSLMLCL